MKVFSYRTEAEWKQAPPEETQHRSNKADPATEEINRVLSDCFRCSNLIILTGLGTSLCVNVDAVESRKKNVRTPQQGKSIAPTMQDLWERVKTEAGDDFDKIISLSRYPLDSDGKNIESLLSYCKVAAEFVTVAEGKHKIDGFITVAETCVREAVRFLAVDDDVSLHADFLRRLMRRSTRKSRTKLFTTNYDLCFEYAARQGRYVVVDGFSHTNPQVFDSLYFSYDVVKRAQNSDSHDYIPNVFLLYKLHGSIDWELNTLTKEIEKAPQTESPLLIYPRNTKYQLAFEQPYIEMMSALQEALRQPDTGLLVIGFGFNDNHIAEPVLSAIRSNLSLKVVVCDPFLAPREDKKGAADVNPYLSQIRYLIERGDARLGLVNTTFEDLIPILPDILAETDLEQHMERVRLLRGRDNVTA